MNVRPRLSQWSQLLTPVNFVRLFCGHFPSPPEFVRLSMPHGQNRAFLEEFDHVKIVWGLGQSVGDVRLTIMAMTD
jgi:hypothetical protein